MFRTLEKGDANASGWPMIKDLKHVTDKHWVRINVLTAKKRRVIDSGIASRGDLGARPRSWQWRKTEGDGVQIPSLNPA